MTGFFFNLPLLAALAVLVSGEKDGNYYPGFTNPNVKRKMYWNDAVNVLQDLDQFESLYIRYHGCVWSPYGFGEDENGCGGEQGDNGEYWYMGRTQCFRANAAYTLYGVLKGDWGPRNKCQKKTFINSFFTTYGVESLAEPFGIDTTYANAYCTSEQENGNDDYENDGNIDYSTWASYGTGCSRKGNFVLNTYSGAFCHGNNYEKTTDYLDSFNSEMQDLDCVQIFDINYYYNDDDGNGRQRRTEDGEEDENQEDENQEDENQEDQYENVAEDILAYSRACNPRLYPQDCPDPYGLVNAYNRALERASHSRGWGGGRNDWMRESSQWAKTGITVAFFVSGFIMMALACHTRHRTAQESKDADAEVKSRGDVPVEKGFKSRIARRFKGFKGTVKETSGQSEETAAEAELAEANSKVAAAMLTSLPAPTTASTSKKQTKSEKRPAMARLSKKFFGKK